MVIFNAVAFIGWIYDTKQQVPEHCSGVVLRVSSTIKQTSYGKSLKSKSLKKDLPLTYTKHYYIGSERVSAKTGTMDKLGNYL